MFWRNNIIGFTPFLEAPVIVESPAGALHATLVGTWFQHPVPVAGQPPFITGIEETNPWWHVQGSWFADGSTECVIGRTLAERLGIHPGQALALDAGSGRRFAVRVVGIVVTGGSEDNALLGPLSLAQRVAHRPGEYRRLLVSAYTKPEDDFARQDPSRMTADQAERWYCSPYPATIAWEVEQMLPGSRARVVRRVAESEGQILGRINALFWLITLGALAAATLAIAAMAAATVIERRTEVALMKALGASSGLLTWFFLAEQLTVALASGALGFGLGTLVAGVLGRLVFGVPATPEPLLLPVVLLMAAILVAAGSMVPLGRMARLHPALVLRGE